MARIPDEQVTRLKQEVSIVRLVEAAGITLKKHGGKDLVGRCPFHNDKTPSLVISPGKNLWHCLGACGVGGSVIDWVMRFHKVSFRHACELLLKDHPALVMGEGQPPSAAEIRRAASPFSLDAGEPALLAQVTDFYHQTLLEAPEALEYLHRRGLGDEQLIRRFRLGYANRTLGYRLPPKQVKAGSELRGALQQLGVMRKSGHEHLAGSIVIPLLDAENRVVQLYGRKIRDNLRKGTAYHLYLPGPHRGVFNREGIEGQAEVILCESLIDSLSFIAAGFENVTTSFGTNGFTDELLEALKACGAQRILIAYDSDAAGNQAAEKLAEVLTKEGFDCFRLNFPKGMDANEYALKVQPPMKSLGLVIRKAEWLGQGERPVLQMAATRQPEIAEASRPEPAQSEKASSLVAELAAKEENPSVPEAEPSAGPESDPASEALAELPAAAVPKPPVPDVEAEVGERDVVLSFGDRRYRVRGLSKNTSFEVLKINLLVSRGEALHVDTFDLYSAKHRQAFARLASAELEVEESVLQRELGKVLLKCEELQERQLEEVMKPKLPAEVEIPEADKQQALALLRDPTLSERILEGFEATGLVGEPVNALTGYLAAVSRKLASPLAIIVQSTSAAGKSALMDAVLDLMPEEDRIHYSAMTGQSLFYLGEQDLKHRILGIAEEEGVRQASYALKLLQSQGELTIASTGKDPQTGKLVTEAYRVEGPVMLMLTTTAIDIDEELLNRCLVLTVDESRDQTRRIQARQRQARTLDGLLAGQTAEAVRTLHRNAQRLLKPLAVVNPYAEHLSFLDERTRTRRDHQKYLTLIDAIALLHQHQRPIKTVEHRGRVVEYVEVEPSDIALANRLAHEVLGRSLDELPPQTRRVLAVICGLVEAKMQAENLERSEVRLTRWEIRQTTGLSDTRLRLHLERLVEMEYLLTHTGRQGRRFVYELLFDGDVTLEGPRLPGLIDAEALLSGQADDNQLPLPGLDSETTTETSPGGEGDFAPRSPAAHPPSAGESPTDEIGTQPSNGKASSDSVISESENAHPGSKKTSASYRSASSSSLAALAAKEQPLTTHHPRPTRGATRSA
jgi:DNA primase